MRRSKKDTEVCKTTSSIHAFKIKIYKSLIKLTSKWFQSHWLYVCFQIRLSYEPLHICQTAALKRSGQQKLQCRYKELRSCYIVAHLQLAWGIICTHQIFPDQAQDYSWCKWSSQATTGAVSTAGSTTRGKPHSLTLLLRRSYVRKKELQYSMLFPRVSPPDIFWFED